MSNALSCGLVSSLKKRGSDVSGLFTRWRLWLGVVGGAGALVYVAVGLVPVTFVFLRLVFLIIIFIFIFVLIIFIVVLDAVELRGHGVTGCAGRGSAVGG
jgi:hypothetical protein